VKSCEVFFVENERTARRFLKLLWKEMVIDNYQWFTIHKAETPVRADFVRFVREKKTIGIISEAGCPGIADPGQILVAAAHQHNAIIKPLVGPSSILLAVMASGLNGQRFQFNGYLPIENAEKLKTLKQLEAESMKKDATQVFIETPYRNNQLLEVILKTLQPSTFLSIAADLTSPSEFIQTKTISEWKKEIPQLNKRPSIFCIYAGGHQPS
jgi:16S rRNA (cytidine1402-2'-O)-methyltransferase